MTAMRIFSSFHDYYDIGLQFGQDPKCIFVREEQQYNGSPKHPQPKFMQEALNNEYFRILTRIPTNIPRTGYPRFYELSYNLILFCGTLYIHYIFDNKHYYSSEIMLKDMLDKKDKQLTKYIVEGPKKWNFSFHNKIKNVNKVIDKLNHQKDFLNLIHREAASPIIVFYVSDFRYPRAILNAKLNTYKFESVVDPYSAYQQISSFITSILGVGENETVDIEDKYKIAQHGYNKHSFRHPVKL